MSKRIVLLATLLISFSGILQNGRADVLAAWDIANVDLDADGSSGIDGNSTSSPYTFTAATLGSDIADAKLTLSGTVTPSTTASQYGFKIPGVDQTTTLTAAITAGHYFQFTLTAAVGFRFNLISIEMLGQSSSTGADEIALLSSVDGFAASNVIASVSDISGVTGGFDTDDSGFGGPIDLSASKFQNLTGITFRLYGYESTSGSGVTHLRNLSGNDLIINGTTELIPEPATFVMVLGGAGVLAMLRRRRR